jgi:hypothetical protein
LCNTFTAKISDSLKKPFLKFCNKYCKPKCNVVNIDTKVEISKHFWNDTILEVIPKKSPHIAYIETLKTDVNRLIYNCGGVIGLWFGISPITAVDLLLYIPEICRILINECATILQFMIAFLVRIKQNIISRVIPLVIRFCSLCIVYFETSMTGFIRSIHNCGRILGLWFGILSIKAVDLFGYIALIYRILINKCTKILQFLIAFWIRIKRNMTSRVTPIEIRFGNGVQLGHN